MNEQSSEKGSFLYFPQLGARPENIFDPEAEAEKILKAKSNQDRLQSLIQEVTHPYYELFNLTVSQLCDEERSLGWVRDFLQRGRRSYTFRAPLNGEVLVGDAYVTVKTKKSSGISIPESIDMHTCRGPHPFRMSINCTNLGLSEIKLGWGNMTADVIENNIGLPTKKIYQSEFGDLREWDIDACGGIAKLELSGLPGLFIKLAKRSFVYGGLTDFEATSPEITQELFYDQNNNIFKTKSSAIEQAKWERYLRSDWNSELSVSGYINLIKKLLNLLPTEQLNMI